MLSQEIERLNGIMKIKQDEMNKIVANYNNLVKENEEMRRHIKESEGVMGQAFNTLKTEN